jgi:predicted MFS family arabinose efflux permease
LPTLKKPETGFVFSLALAVFGTGMLDVVPSLFLVDIAKTFLGNSSYTSIAVAGQIATISSIAAVVFGLLTSFLSVKVDRKKLLLLGLSCIAIGSVGCYYAPNLTYMQIFYPLDGAGTIIVSAMTFALIGESLPPKNRAKPIGIVTAGGIISSAIGFTVAGLIASISGWRAYLLWYVMPISLIAFGLSYMMIPPRQSSPATVERNSLSGSFEEIFSNKSAISCLLGYTLMGVAAVWAFFAPTFWGKQYGIQIQDIGIITSAIVIVHALGGIVGGRLVDSHGRKPTVLASWTMRGILVAAIALMPDFWSAFTMSSIAMFVGGVSVSSGHSLNLEQTPKARGTMMSLCIVFAYAGASIGVALGSLVLATSSFQLMGITFGALNTVAALTIFLFAKDPLKQQIDQES